MFLLMSDFLGLFQPSSVSRRRQVCQVLLNTIDNVLRHCRPPLQRTNIGPKTSARQRFVVTIKEILGWIIDTHKMTLMLTPRRSSCLAENLDGIPSSQRQMSIKKWHRILGKLRSMSIALPGSQGLFSLLQEAFCADAGPSRIRLSPILHQILANFKQIHHHLHLHPTELAKLIPVQPTVHGSHDAAKPGGVLLTMPHTVPCRSTFWPQPRAASNQ